MDNKSGLCRQLAPLWPYVRPRLHLLSGVALCIAAVSVGNLLLARGLGAALDTGLAGDMPPALSQVNLQIQPGQTVALVGPSGSGKSTLCKLSLGLYPTTAGTIAVQGRDLNSYTLQKLRSLIAYVPQDCFLYTGTVGENIAYGRPGASQTEIEQAAKAANAHDSSCPCRRAMTPRSGSAARNSPADSANASILPGQY